MHNSKLQIDLWNIYMCLRSRATACIEYISFDTGYCVCGVGVFFENIGEPWNIFPATDTDILRVFAYVP